ncbi:MAG: hypothetical protein Q8942_18080 [Bacillota bacterium]|nr:hypothetical protein [Bacillota bacterium]
MIRNSNISKDQALNAIKNGEFGREVIGSQNIVVIIMTQDWCPQWIDMKSWIYNVETDKSIDIYELIYNKVDYFYDFKNFKETRWKNYNIPYLRIYKNGNLFKQTNYISQQEFLDVLNSI